MDAFSEQIVEWQWFYATVATASATLMGLLFVSLSVSRDSSARPGNARLHAARQSFGDFLYVLMIGLVFLVPQHAPVGLAVALFVMGAARGLGLAYRSWRQGRPPAPAQPALVLRLAAVLREYGLPVMAVLGLIWVGIEILRGDTTSIFVLVAVIAALLTTASWNAWLLLVED